jgi:hypothetical protein
MSEYQNEEVINLADLDSFFVTATQTFLQRSYVFALSRPGSSLVFTNPFRICGRIFRHNSVVDQLLIKLILIESQKGFTVI